MGIGVVQVAVTLLIILLLVTFYAQVQKRA